MPSSSPAFCPSNPLPLSPPHQLPQTSPRSKRHVPKAQITTVSPSQLSALTSSTRGVVVLKCFARYCASCRGVEPKFRKIAKAYEQTRDQGKPEVAFCQMDYASDEAFCKKELGVERLPFFGIWRDGKYEGGEPMGWTSVGRKLVDRIDQALAGEKE